MLPTPQLPFQPLHLPGLPYYPLSFSSASFDDTRFSEPQSQAPGRVGALVQVGTGGLGREAGV